MLGIMNRMLVSAALLLAAATATAGQIYRWTDARGNVVFGDNPPEGVNAEPVKMRPLQTYSAPMPATRPAVPDDDAEAQETGQAAAVRYAGVRILSPQDDEPIRSNNGFLQIRFSADPVLAEGDVYEVLMDGKPVGRTTTGNLDLENVDRGTHRLQVRIVGPDGKTRASSPEITFHLLRHHL